MPKQEWIRAALKEKGFKLKDVAEALAVPAPRITDILQGRREVQSDEVVPLADMLGLNARSLLKSLELGERTEVAGDDTDRLPILGALTRGGQLGSLPDDLGFESVPLPPDAAKADGLVCYVMGDQSMAPDVPVGSLIIAADPKHHYAPMVPGALVVLPRGKDVMLRRYEKDEAGRDWLTTLDDTPEKQPFSLLSDLMPGGDQLAEETIRLSDVSAVVLWVHQRRSAPAPAGASPSS